MVYTVLLNKRNFHSYILALSQFKSTENRKKGYNLISMFNLSPLEYIQRDWCAMEHQSDVSMQAYRVQKIRDIP